MQDRALYGGAAGASEGAAAPAGLPPLPPGAKGGPGGSVRPAKSTAAQLKEALTKIKKLKAAVAGPPQLAPAVQVIREPQSRKSIKTDHIRGSMKC
jgi:hypothetical protein